MKMAKTPKVPKLPGIPKIKTNFVNGYFKKDGTYVPPHWKS
jgi:hypothetical protein